MRRVLVWAVVGVAGLAILVSRTLEAGGLEPARGAAAVERVVDGDTVVLADGSRVRLVQIDAPELRGAECHGPESAAELERLLPPGTAVRLEADPGLDAVDRYGRLLRYLLAGDENVNLVLVRKGAATVWFYGGDRGRYAGELLEAARAAREAGLGLWGACPGTPFDPLRAADTG